MNEGSMFVSVMYGLIGAMGALSIVVFGWGFVVYISRLGTVRREGGIHIMQWSVRLMVTVLVLIGILNFTQSWFGLS